MIITAPITALRLANSPAFIETFDVDSAAITSLLLIWLSDIITLLNKTNQKEILGDAP
jgi:hypothetical protein